MALTRRVEILFDPDQHAALEELARARGQSVASVIRSAVERECLAPALGGRRQAVEELLEMEIFVGEWEELKEELRQAVARQIEAT